MLTMTLYWCFTRVKKRKRRGIYRKSFYEYQQFDFVHLIWAPCTLDVMSGWTVGLMGRITNQKLALNLILINKYVNRRAQSETEIYKSLLVIPFWALFVSSRLFFQYFVLSLLGNTDYKWNTMFWISFFTTNA